jgi:transposase
MPTPKTTYRAGRVGYGLVTLAVLNAGLGTDTAALVAAGAVLFVGFFPASRHLAARVGHRPHDERTRRLTRRAAGRAVYLLFGGALTVYLLGRIAAATGGLSGVVGRLSAQAGVVVTWTALAICVSSLAHGVHDWLRRRRLEG